MAKRQQTVKEILRTFQRRKTLSQEISWKESKERGYLKNCTTHY